MMRTLHTEPGKSLLEWLVFTPCISLRSLPNLLHHKLVETGNPSWGPFLEGNWVKNHTRVKKNRSLHNVPFCFLEFLCFSPFLKGTLNNTFIFLFVTFDVPLIKYLLELKQKHLLSFDFLYFPFNPAPRKRKKTTK